MQGHIAFPLILDLSPFMTTEVEITNWEGVHKGQLKLQSQKTRAHLNLINAQYESILNRISKPTGEKVSSEILVANGSQCTTSLRESFPEKSKLYPTDGFSKASNIDMHEQHNDKVG